MQHCSKINKRKRLITLVRRTSWRRWYFL